MIYSPKLSLDQLDRASTASFSSLPSAISVMVVPFDNAERQNAQQTLRVDAAVFLLHPDAALELIGLSE
jgi:polysaccharide deacetylase 2 family uncharacterized protein YibQ